MFDNVVPKAHAIAMKIEGLSHAQLDASVRTDAPYSFSSLPQASVSAGVGPGRLVVGGGAWISPPDERFLTASAPMRDVNQCQPSNTSCQPSYVIDGWTVRSKDHVVPAVFGAYTAAELYELLPELTVGGQT